MFNENLPNIKIERAANGFIVTITRQFDGEKAFEKQMKMMAGLIKPNEGEEWKNNLLQEEPVSHEMKEPVAQTFVCTTLPQVIEIIEQEWGDDLPY